MICALELDIPGLIGVLFIPYFSAPSGRLDAWLKVPDDGDDIAQLCWKVRAPLTTLTYLKYCTILYICRLRIIYINTMSQNEGVNKIERKIRRKKEITCEFDYYLKVGPKTSQKDTDSGPDLTRSAQIPNANSY